MNADVEDAEHGYKPTNREKSRRATKHLFWCGCDRALVGQYGKCPHCGCIDKSRNK